MTNILIGIVIGVIFALIVKRKENQSKQKFNKLSAEKDELTGENYDLKFEISQNKVSINKLTSQVESLTLRMDNAEAWFGSVIRHSREQFSKEAVEKFLEEHGMRDE